MSKRPRSSNSALLNAYNNVVSGQNEKLANEILIEQQSALQSLRNAGALKARQSKAYDALPSSAGDEKLPKQNVAMVKGWHRKVGDVKRRLSKIYLEGGAMKGNLEHVVFIKYYVE